MLAPRYPQLSIASVPGRFQNRSWRLRLTFVEQGEQPSIHTFILLATCALTLTTCETLMRIQLRAPL